MIFLIVTHSENGALLQPPKHSIIEELNSKFALYVILALEEPGLGKNQRYFSVAKRGKHVEPITIPANHRNEPRFNSNMSQNPIQNISVNLNVKNKDTNKLKHRIEKLEKKVKNLETENSQLKEKNQKQNLQTIDHLENLGKLIPLIFFI